MFAHSNNGEVDLVTGSFGAGIARGGLYGRAARRRKVWVDVAEKIEGAEYKFTGRPNENCGGAAVEISSSFAGNAINV